MPIYRLNEDLWFPSESEFSSDIVAVGGDLSTERLIAAYSQGIFPWYNEPGEMVWWCPEFRAIVYPSHLHVSHSMRNRMNKGGYEIKLDTAFDKVLEGCREGERVGNTWLLDEVFDAYMELHRLGIAHSVEVWEDGQLTGGLYGVSLGHMFVGESMFARKSNASKLAFIWIVRKLGEMGWKFVDCQVMNEHLESLGAEEISREDYLIYLRHQLKYPTLQGNWGELLK